MSEHDWEDLPLSSVSPFSFEGQDKEGRTVKFNLSLNFVLKAESHRRCRRCGVESIDGKMDDADCDVALARSVMES